VAAGGATLVASLRSSPGDGSVTICATAITPVPPILTKVFGAESIAPGGTTTLTFTLTNPNGIALTGVSFTDTLPSDC